MNRKFQDFRITSQDFPSGPVVKTLPSSSGGAGSIPGRGTKIPLAMRYGQKKKFKKKTLKKRELPPKSRDKGQTSLCRPDYLLHKGLSGIN